MSDNQSPVEVSIAPLSDVSYVRVMDYRKNTEFNQVAWQQWRDELDNELRQDHGWLTLIALTWLDSTPSPIAQFPGEWACDDGVVTVSVRSHDRVTLDGKPATGTIEIPLGADEFPRLEAGSRLAEIAPRRGRVCIRIRDNDATLRARFSAVPAWAYSDDWIIPVDFSLYDEPRTREIFTAQEGLINTMDFVGEATIELDETTYHLAVSGESDKPFVIFSDSTGTDQSSPWRNAPLQKRGDQWVIDFNYAQNFPAAYTPFGTCPKPVAENVLDVAIPAGHQRPREKFAD
ncbi:MAG: DUF1684 domain-containing protein [Actinomycetaceae bacterium]|nr:DUF1684 domain-containing protein [Actinomycetaceae bacterium]